VRGGCDFISDDIFCFKNFKVGPAFVKKPTNAVPEPSSALLMGLGVATMGRFSRRARMAS